MSRKRIKIYSSEETSWLENLWYPHLLRTVHYPTILFKKFNINKRRWLKILLLLTMIWFITLDSVCQHENQTTSGAMMLRRMINLIITFDNLSCQKVWSALTTTSTMVQLFPYLREGDKSLLFSPTLQSNFLFSPPHATFYSILITTGQ